MTIYPIQQQKIALGLILAFIFSIILASCRGYSAEPISPTPVTPTARPTRTPLPPRPTATIEPSPTPIPIPTLEVVEARLKGVDILIWRLHSHLLPSADGMDTFQNLVDEFNRTNEWGIVVQTVSYDDYRDIFDALHSSIYGEMPDLVLGYTYQAARLSHTASLPLDLTPYLHDPRWGLSREEMDDFYPLFWEQDQIGETRLGLPFYRSGQVLLYNLSWAEELGFDGPPLTPDEFKAQACAAASANQAKQDPQFHGTGGWVIDLGAPTMAAWIYAFGGELQAPDGQGYAFESQETARAFAFLRNLYDDGCAWQPGSIYPNQEFADRQALFISSSLTGIPFQASALNQAGSRDSWTAIPFPSDVGSPAIVSYGPSFIILRSQPEKQLAAWLFSKWMLSVENQARWVRQHGTLSTRASVTEHLSDYLETNPQWAAVSELLAYARGEPNLPSWSLVHLVLNDAGRRLFSPLVTTRQISEIIETLDQTADELNGQFR